MKKPIDKENMIYRISSLSRLSSLSRVSSLSRFSNLFGILLLAALVLAGCFNDDDLKPRTNSDDMASTVDVQLRLTPVSPVATDAATRGVAVKAPETEAGKAGENMKSWFVVMAQDGKVVKIISSADELSEKINGETSRGVGYIRSLATGTYTCYSFANLTLADVGLSGLAEGGDLPINLVSKTIKVMGNQDAVEAFTSGIPMSNVQSVEVTADTRTINLGVVRMVAKIRVEVSNPTTQDITVSSVSLTDITPNPADDGADNLFLLPGEVTNDDTGARAVNLNGDRATRGRETRTYTVPTDDKTIAAGESKTYEFYVNESETREKTETLSPHFVLTLATEQGQSSIGSTQRYAFLDWSAIARNEIHVLPVSLQRFTIGFTVRAYTAIGVAPTVDNTTDITTYSLGLYGHYDFMPVVRDLFSGNAYYRDAYGATRLSDGTTPATGSPTVNSISMELGELEDDDYGGWTSNDASDVDANGNKVVHLPYVYWNKWATQPRMECEVGNYTGWAIYTVNATVTDENNNVFEITKRLRIQNTYLDHSQLARKRRAGATLIAQ